MFMPMLFLLLVEQENKLIRLAADRWVECDHHSIIVRITQRITLSNETKPDVFDMLFTLL